jgi:hypothetical protein
MICMSTVGTGQCCSIAVRKGAEWHTQHCSVYQFYTSLLPYPFRLESRVACLYCVYMMAK